MKKNPFSSGFMWHSISRPNFREVVLPVGTFIRALIAEYTTQCLDCSGLSSQLLIAKGHRLRALILLSRFADTPCTALPRFVRLVQEDCSQFTMMSAVFDKEPSIYEIKIKTRLYCLQIGVSPERFAFAQLLGLPDVFTVLPNLSVSAPSELPRICAVPRRSVNLDHLRILNENGPTIGIVPSGWRSLDAAAAKASERGVAENRPGIATGGESGLTSNQGLRSASLPLGGVHAGKASATEQKDPSDEGRASIDECRDGASLACGPVLTSAEERKTAVKEAPPQSDAQRPKVPPVVRGAAAAAAKMEPLKRPQPMPRAPCQPLLFRVPYSLHSCFAELEAFVRLVRPRVIRPIAQKDPYGLDMCPNTHFGEMCKLWSEGRAQPKPLPVPAKEEASYPGLVRGVKGRFDDELLDAEDKALALRMRRSRKRGAAVKVRRVWVRKKRLRIGSVSPANERPDAPERDDTCMEGVEVFEERMKNRRGDAQIVTGEIVSKSSGVEMTRGPQAARRGGGTEEEPSGCGRRIEIRRGVAVKVEETSVESGLELDVRLGSAAVQRGQRKGHKLAWADESAGAQKVQDRFLAISRPDLSLERHVVRMEGSGTEPKSGATMHPKVEHRHGQIADPQASSFDPTELDQSVGKDAIGSEGAKEDDDVAYELPAWYLEAYGRWVAKKGAVDSTPVSKVVKREVPPVEIEQTIECTAVRAATRTLPYFMLRGCPEVGA